MFGVSIQVREGEPGWADDSEHTCETFTSFKDAYVYLCKYDIRKRWPHLRHVHRFEMYNVDGPRINVCRDGFTVVVKDLCEIGVSEDELDAAIRHVSGQDPEVSNILRKVEG